MPDRHFLVALRDRFLLTVCQEGARCNHRRLDGHLCGAYLDARGHHARKCCIGGSLEGRHNAVREWCASAWAQCVGTPAATEQHVPQWDRPNPRTGLLEEARLDVATADPHTGSPLYRGVVVKAAHSDDPGRLRARARRDGCAAAETANGKRARYPEAGMGLVPFALEDGGRPCDEAVSFVCFLAASRMVAEDGNADWGGAALLWQELSTVLQLGNAEVILGANGR